MKTKKLSVLLIGILLSAQMFANHVAFGEQTESWLKKTESRGASRPGITDPASPDAPTAPNDAPIGDALAPVLLFALIYGAYRQVRKKSARSIKSN